MTEIGWGNVSTTKQVVAYVQNEGNASFYLYVYSENWSPQVLAKEMNIYTTPFTQEVGVEEISNMSIVLFPRSLQGFNNVSFSFDIIVCAVNDAVTLLQRQNFSQLVDYNLNTKLAFEEKPHIVGLSAFQVSTLDWFDANNTLSINLLGGSSGDLVVNWKNMSSKVKVELSNGSYFDAWDFWNSTTKNIALPLTIDDEMKVSIYMFEPQVPPWFGDWYMWGWVIPALATALWRVLKKIKNPHVRLLVIVLIEDSLLRIIPVVILANWIPLWGCFIISIVTDALAHAIGNWEIPAIRFGLATLYNSIWYGLYLAGSLVYPALGIVLGVAFHMSIDEILSKRSKNDME